jgi:signal-transduction protein with cAMP-binding, CBS, and nucleotidyltransferase domain
VVTKSLDPNATKINSIMSKPLLTMDHYLSRTDANELMLRKKIKHLVVTKFGKVAGILTLKDMIAS